MPLLQQIDALTEAAENARLDGDVAASIELAIAAAERIRLYKLLHPKKEDQK